MIDPVIGWFEITQYNNNIAISIKNLVKTKLKLCERLDTLEKWKSRMTKDQNLLVLGS